MDIRRWLWLPFALASTVTLASASLLPVNLLFRLLALHLDGRGLALNCSLLLLHSHRLLLLSGRLHRRSRAFNCSLLAFGTHWSDCLRSLLNTGHVRPSPFLTLRFLLSTSLRNLKFSLRLDADRFSHTFPLWLF